MRKCPLFSIIMDTYYRPAMLKEAVNALYRQTYDNLEIILINNGATQETVEYLDEISERDKRIRLLHFKENQYSPDDPVKMLYTCLNPALEMATGDYIWYQSDDDIIADDYAEKMVALFLGNPDCTTAAGLPVSINADGKVIQEPRVSNFRQRYVRGDILALDYLHGGKMFSAPGTIFSIKRQVLRKSGGFHRYIEYSQLFGIVPFGISGFDETAIFYWRRHESQLNKKLTANGWVGIKECFSLLKEWEIEKRWERFGKDTAKEVVYLIENKICSDAAMWFAINLSFLRFKAAFCIYKQIWGHVSFWAKLTGALFMACYKQACQQLHTLNLKIKKNADKE